MQAVNTLIEIKAIEPKREKLSVLMRMAFLFPVFTGIHAVVDIVISAILLSCAIVYFKKDQFILLFPVFLIYSPVLYLYPGGVSWINVFALLCCLRLILLNKTLDCRASNIILILLLLYAACVYLVYASTYESVILMMGFVGMWHLISEFNRNEELKERMMSIFVFMCISSMIYAVMNGNINMSYDMGSDSGGALDFLGRYSGTQKDPNYMAFFLCAGFAFSLTQQRLRLWHKVVLCVIMFGAISLTGSMTALACSLSTLAFYVLISKKLTGIKRFLLILTSCLLILLIFVFLISEGTGDGFFGVYRIRLGDIMDSAIKGNFSGATSGRTMLQSRYYDYFRSANLFRQIFGGYCVNAYLLKGEPFATIGAAPHNTYLDIMFTCGLFGLALFIIAVLIQLRICGTKYRNEKKPADLRLLLGKIIWLIFACAISVFPSWSYLILLFLL